MAIYIAGDSYGDSVASLLFAAGKAFLRYEVLYGQDMVDVSNPSYTNARDYIASDTSASGPFLSYRANTSSTYWTKINRAKQHGGPIMVDIEPVYTTVAGERTNYNTSAAHVITYVNQDAPDNLVTLYDCPLRQWNNGSSDFYNATERAACVTSFNGSGAAYSYIDFPCVWGYQPYRFWDGYESANNDALADVVTEAAGLGRGSPWAQVWGSAFDSQRYTISTASWSGGVATYTTTASHGIGVGDVVAVTGITPTGYNLTSSNAIVTGVTSTTFTVAVTSDPGTYTSGGKVSHYVDADGDELDSIATILGDNGIEHVLLFKFDPFDGAAADSITNIRKVTDPFVGPPDGGTCLITGVAS